MRATSVDGSWVLFLGFFGHGRGSSNCIERGSRAAVHKPHIGLKV